MRALTRILGYPWDGTESGLRALAPQVPIVALVVKK